MRGVVVCCQFAQLTVPKSFLPQFVLVCFPYLLKSLFSNIMHTVADLLYKVFLKFTGLIRSEISLMIDLDM